MPGKEGRIPAMGVKSPKSDVVESLRPVVTLSRVLLCFSRLRCDLSSERPGVIPRLVQVVSTLLLFSTAIYILGLVFMGFFQEDPVNRLRDLFTLLMYFSFIAASFAFCFVSNYKHGTLIHLIHLHDDVASTLFDLGSTVSTFKVETSLLRCFKNFAGSYMHFSIFRQGFWASCV